MGEILGLLVVVCLIVGGATAGAVALTNYSRRNRLLANSPLGALVQPTDSAAEALAKNRNFRMLQEAVRIFHFIKQREEVMPSLPRQTLDEIDALLDEYYDHHS